MADLDRAHRRIDAQVARDADRLLRREIDDREEDRVVARLHRLDPRGVLGRRREGAVRQVGPVAAFAVRRVGSVQRRGVRRRVERLEAAQAPLHRRARRSRPRRPVRDGLTDRLPELIRSLRHLVVSLFPGAPTGATAESRPSPPVATRPSASWRSGTTARRVRAAGAPAPRSHPPGAAAMRAPRTR